MEQKGKINLAEKLKASTATLLLLLLTSFVLVGSLTIAINQKVSRKEFTNSDPLEYARIPLPPVSIVSVSNLSNCLIVASDSLRLKIVKPYNQEVQVKLAGDTVHVVGTPHATDRRDDQKLVLYLPSGSTVISNSSTIELKGGREFLKRPSFSFVLDKTSISSSAHGYHTFFEKLEIEGSGNSSVNIFEKVHIQNVMLSNVYDAKFEEGKQIEFLTTSFDSKGKVAVRSNREAIIIGSN